MSRQGLNQHKPLSHSSSTPAKTGSFQSRPFAEPADSEAVSTQQQETPDLQTQLDKAARFGHHFGRVRVGNTSSVIQPKLTVGAPGDKYEQEADQVAAQVMGMAEATNQQPVQREMALEEEQESVQTKPLAASITPLVQREVAAAPEEEDLLQTKSLAGSNLQREMGSEPEEEELLQTKPSLQRATTDGSFEAGNNLENRLSSSKSGGSLLSNEVRTFMEPRFGADFSQVRIHTDSEAVQMNKDLGAQAFTHGQDIYFGEGKSPGISELTAHELTHVVQQTEGVQTKPAIDRIGQQQPRVQREPLTLATLGIGGALGSMTVVDAAAVAGAVIGASATAVQAGVAVQPGASGVQTVQLENGWMSNVDKQKLEMITQYRLINAYVRQWATAHPGQSLAHPEPEETSTTTTTTTTTTTPTSSRRRPSTTTGESIAVTTTEGGPATSGSEVDQAIRAAVKAEVQLQLEQDLNRHQKTSNSQEYIWSDSGDHTADTFGTVGSIQFVQMRGTALRETLQLSPEASQIPGLVVPMAGTEVVVTQFRGGRLVRGASMETGLNDDLGINLVGSGPTYDQAGNSGHGTHTYATEWNWDDNTTSAEFDVMIQEDGMPKIDPPRWSGTPED